MNESAYTPSPSHPLVLIGFMGSGKSHIARELAHISGYEIIDTDHVIEEMAGCTIPELFKIQGEAAFRQIEQTALTDALGKGGLISTGGGIITRPENCAVLRQAAENGALIVYLRAKPETLAQRIRQQPGARPLIDGNGHLNMADTIVRVQEILSTRAALYETSANFIVDTDGKLPQRIATEIWHEFRSKYAGLID